jgi:D-glycero-D-manno-heptose 1,7-bisphosphate phosphatase
MQQFNAALCNRLAESGVRIQAIYYCPYHPTEGVGPYKQESPLRKPNPGMIDQAAQEHNLDLSASFAIGDKMSDVVAGRRAGCRAILVRTGMAGADKFERLYAEFARPDCVAADLAEAAEFIASFGQQAPRREKVSV